MIVVTGAAGLIGSAVVRELNRRGYKDLLLVDDLGSSEKWRNLSSLRFKRYMEKDEFLFCVERVLRNELQPKENSGLEKISLIIHLGACSSTTERNLSFLIQNNYRYSIQLACLAEKIKARMVYASSAATYGDGSLGFDEDMEQLEKLCPLNAYAYSKQLFDLWMKERKFQDSCVGIKYFNIFGPNEYHKANMRSLVLKAYEEIGNKGSLGLFKSYHPDYEDGKQKRDFLYVEDAARMTLHLCIENTRAVGLFNVGSGIASSWLELAEAIFAAMNKKKRIRFIDMPMDIRSKYQYYTCAPITKLREAGYRQNISALSDAVHDYISNYLRTGALYA